MRTSELFEDLWLASLFTFSLAVPHAGNGAEKGTDEALLGC